MMPQRPLLSDENLIGLGALAVLDLATTVLLAWPLFTRSTEAFEPLDWYFFAVTVATSLLLIGAAICLLLPKMWSCALWLQRNAFWGLALRAASSLLASMMLINENGQSTLHAITAVVFGLTAGLAFCGFCYLMHLDSTAASTAVPGDPKTFRN